MPPRCQSSGERESSFSARSVRDAEGVTSKMREAPALTIALSVCLAPLSMASAQERLNELTPRAIADSTYAVRIAVDQLAESLRRGQLDSRHINDPELATATIRLATAARDRARRPPHPSMGNLWDLQIELFEFQPEGPAVLRAQARVFLAAAVDSSTRPVILTFLRRGDRWDLVAHEGFVLRLAELALHLNRTAS